MSPNHAVSVSCPECESLSVRITQLEKRIETLQDIRANEEFIDSIIAPVLAVEQAQEPKNHVPKNLSTWENS